MHHSYRVSGLNIVSDVVLPLRGYGHKQPMASDAVHIRVTSGEVPYEIDGASAVSGNFTPRGEAILIRRSGLGRALVVAGRQITVQSAHPGRAPISARLLRDALITALHQHARFPIWGTAFGGHHGNIIIAGLPKSGVTGFARASTFQIGDPAEFFVLNSADANQVATPHWDTVVILPRWHVPASAPPELRAITVFEALKLLRGLVCAPELVQALDQEALFLRCASALLDHSRRFEVTRPQMASGEDPLITQLWTRINASAP